METTWKPRVHSMSMFLRPSLEALSFSASLRLSGPREDRKELISELLGSLGLRSCAHTCPHSGGRVWYHQGVIRLPLLGGNNKKHMYGDFEKFPQIFPYLNNCIVWVGCFYDPCTIGPTCETCDEYQSRYIGNAVLNGLSGGQRKRTAIGVVT